MQVNQATLDDGRNCAILIQLLKAGRWNFSGGDVAAYATVMKWVHEIGNQLAPQMKALEEPKKEEGTGNTPSTDTGFSVVATGKLPTKHASKKRK